MSKLLKDHIDEPILKATVGLNLLGIRTIFSCCGFDYKNPKVAKKHILNKPYFFIDYASLNESKKAGLFEMMNETGWHFNRISGGMIDLFYWNQDWVKNHPFAASDSPHRYEQACLAIKAVEDWIGSNRTLFLKCATIVDGNSKYKNELGFKYWQYDPCEDWVVTPEIYDSL